MAAGNPCPTENFGGTSSLSSVGIWGRTPPPIGGVTSSVDLQLASVVKSGRTAVSFGPQEARRWTFGLRLVQFLRCRLIVYNISGLRGIYVGLLARWPWRSVTVGYFHGGALGRSLSSLTGPWGRIVRFILHGFDEVWVTNQTMADDMAAAYELTPMVISPARSTMATTRSSTKPPAEGVLLVTAAFNASPLYNLDVVCGALRKLHGENGSARLVVMLYGDDRARIEAWRPPADIDPLVEVLVNIAHSEVSERLAQADVLLRMTDSDGDSVIVREALEMGLRVIASAAAPRPRAAELCDIDADAVVQAIRNGGEPSTGAGLGTSCVDEVTRLCRSSN